MIQKIDRLWVWSILVILGWAFSLLGHQLLDKWAAPQYQPSPQEGLAFYFPLHGSLENKGGSNAKLVSEFPPLWRDGGLAVSLLTYSTARLVEFPLDAFDRSYTLSFWMQVSREHFVEDNRPWNGNNVYGILFVGNKLFAQNPTLELSFNNISGAFGVQTAHMAEWERADIKYDFLEQQYAAHWVVVRSAEKVEVYLNGQLAQELLIPQNPSEHPIDFAMLSEGHLPGGRFTISELTFWERGLSPDEAKSQFSNLRNHWYRYSNPLVEWAAPNYLEGGSAGPWFKTPTWAWWFWFPLYLLTLGATVIFWVRWIPWLLWLLSDEREP